MSEENLDNRHGEMECVCVLMPVIGLILWLISVKRYPYRAKHLMRHCLYSFSFWFVFGVVMGIFSKD